MTFYLSISGYTIKVTFLETEWPEKKSKLISQLNEYFKEFITTKLGHIDANISIQELSGIPFISKSDVYFSQYFRKVGKTSYVTYYHVSIFELSQLLLIIIIDLLKDKGFLLHASGIKTKQGVVLFMGPSSAGKTTTMKMLMSRFTPFSDDCVAIRRNKKVYSCYQVPWIEKDRGLITRGPTPEHIKMLVSIQKGKSFRVTPQLTMQLPAEIVKNIWTTSGISRSTILAVRGFLNEGVKWSKIALTLEDGVKLQKELENII